MSLVTHRLKKLAAGRLFPGPRGGRSRPRLTSKRISSGRRWGQGFVRTEAQRSTLENFKFQVPHPGVAKSLDYISRHWGKSIGVMDLVRVARMSRRGFLKAFQRHTGGTPGRRLRAIRLENARRMLRGSGDKLGTIARGCGYRSVNSFIIAFKREVGLAPIQYRESNRSGRRYKTGEPASRPRRISNLLCRKLNGDL
jgi:AraC-like DNA-binding protein